ncbi:hypothetical protein CO2235_230351 [Cupriavidus oxalaticus]|uniref:Uncharacterized protein n=1 Tax=Cupriavidus oxalaticus TaxID=96344 RepID=A0A375FR12_9BURK|nr:hypothetical protein CO2235_U750002 [Cupriavidus oxalaticus]SPC15143.1 hypothetical protein CO2235_230351 [Cupriavidus oxalaticus]
MAPVGTGAHYKVYYLALLAPVFRAPHRCPTDAIGKRPSLFPSEPVSVSENFRFRVPARG